MMLEFRLHPVSGYRPPAGCSHYDIWEAVVTQLSQGADPQALRLGNEVRPLTGLWDGLEAFPAYGDEIEPAAARERSRPPRSRSRPIAPASSTTRPSATRGNAPTARSRSSRCSIDQLDEL